MAAAYPLVFAAVLVWDSLPWLQVFNEPPVSTRSMFYSVVAGVAAGLLGFTFAAIAILISIPKDRAAPRQQAAFISVRGHTVSLLLGTSLGLALALSTSLGGLLIDQSNHAPTVLVAILSSSACVSGAGLILSGITLALLLNSIKE